MTRPRPGRLAAPASWPGWRGGSDPSFCCPLLLEEEGREVKGYLSIYRESPAGAVGPTALTLARESKEHADPLAELSRRVGRAVAQDRGRRIPA